MTTTTATIYRYQLPRKSIKADCPDCGPKHRRTLSRYIDTQTGEPIALPYGRCDRESNCGYHLSPYDKGNSGMSYADVQFERWKEENPLPTRTATAQEERATADLDNSQKTAIWPVLTSTQMLSSRCSAKIYSIPDEVFRPTIGHYADNQFATLLRQEFGTDKAVELLHRFQIGTSAHWPGATVYWLIDEQLRVRAGQVVLFGEDWHRVKYVDREGRNRPCISSVSHGLLKRYRKAEQMPPDWLTDYHDNAPRWPCLFGVHQLATAPLDQPVAVVEAPKTAVICAAYFPGMVWLAVGALSYLTLNTDDGRQRLAPLKDRAIILLPDLSKDGKTYQKWTSRADELRAEGYRISVVDYLERTAHQTDKDQGLDLADFLLRRADTGHDDPLASLSTLSATVKRFDAFPPAPLSWNADLQLTRIRWCVLPSDVDEADHNPN